MSPFPLPMIPGRLLKQSFVTLPLSCFQLLYQLALSSVSAFCGLLHLSVSNRRMIGIAVSNFDPFSLYLSGPTARPLAHPPARLPLNPPLPILNDSILVKHRHFSPCRDKSTEGSFRPAFNVFPNILKRTPSNWSLHKRRPVPPVVLG